MNRDITCKVFHNNHGGPGRKGWAKREMSKLRRRIGKAEARNGGTLRNGKSR